MPEELTKRIAIGALTTAAAVVVALPRADGQTRDGDRNEGGVRWMDPSGRHTVENVGQSELLAIRVEIKQAPARP